MARVREHKDKAIPGFTARYNFDTLVHYEGFSHPLTAIKREKKSKAGFGKKIETHLGIESRLGGPEQRMG